jgi:hypothetical protein
MSAVQAVAKGTGKVVLSVVGDVRFMVVLALGVGAGIWLSRYWWEKWRRGLFHPPLIGQNPNPDLTIGGPLPPAVPLPPVPGKPPPGQPANARPPGQPSPGVPAHRRWRT